MTEVDTEPALTAAARFAASVADLKSRVAVCRHAVESLRGCWGTGTDGQTFGSKYEPWAADILAAMDALLLRLADTGDHTGVAILRTEATDEENAADLNGVGGSARI
jgi:hypothetical protein